MVLELSDTNFEQEVIKHKGPVLIDFWAAWCVPCKLMAPVVDEIDHTFKGALKVGKVDVDENPELATRYSVLNIPTLLVFKGGEEVTRIIGVNSKESVVSKLKGIVGA